MLTHGNKLYITGETAQDTIALLSYNYHTGQMTDYSLQLWSYRGTPLELTYANGQILLAGFKQPFQSHAQPLLIAFNPRSLESNDASSIIPATFGSIGGIASDDNTIFLSGGEFLTVNYGLVKGQD